MHLSAQHIQLQQAYTLMSGITNRLQFYNFLQVINAVNITQDCSSTSSLTDCAATDLGTGFAKQAWMLQLRHKCCNLSMGVATQAWVLQLRYRCCNLGTGAATQAQVLQLRHRCCNLGTGIATWEQVLQLRHRCCNLSTGIATDLTCKFKVPTQLN